MLHRLPAFPGTRGIPVIRNTGICTDPCTRQNHQPGMVPMKSARAAAACSGCTGTGSGPVRGMGTDRLEGRRAVMLLSCLSALAKFVGTTPAISGYPSGLAFKLPLPVTEALCQEVHGHPDPGHLAKVLVRQQPQVDALAFQWVRQAGQFRCRISQVAGQNTKPPPLRIRLNIP